MASLLIIVSPTPYLTTGQSYNHRLFTSGRKKPGLVFALQICMKLHFWPTGVFPADDAGLRRTFFYQHRWDACIRSDGPDWPMPGTRWHLRGGEMCSDAESNNNSFTLQYQKWEATSQFTSAKITRDIFFFCLGVVRPATKMTSNTG